MNRSSISSAGVLITAVVALGVGLLSPSAAEARTRTQETTNLDSRITADPDLPKATKGSPTCGSAPMGCSTTDAPRPPT